MNRRSESAKETRERIVRATYKLHTEKGLAATSVRDIAERADVAVGSVYHHFPTYDDVVQACGAYTHQLTRPPMATIFEGIDAVPARLKVLVDSQFSFYERFPGLERIRADRDKFARLDAALLAEEASLRDLLAVALKKRRLAKQRFAVAFAMLDVVVYRTLRADGLSHEAAVDSIAALIQQWLLGEG